MNSEDQTAEPTEKKARRARVLQVAEFDPRLRSYINYSVVALCTITIVGLLILPFWLFFGRRYLDRYFDNLECKLTSRSLQFKKGVWFHQERTIPLDKIQDLTFSEGPILRKFGLSTLKVETAGQSAYSEADLSLTGIVEAHKFRARVLDQRDEVTEIYRGSPSGNSSDSASAETLQILKEIRDSLRSIENKIDRN